MTEVETEAKIMQQAHKRGRMVVLLALVAGVGIAVLLMGWFGQPPAALVQVVSVHSQQDMGVPRPRQGLILTNENRGRVFFGRSCDSCHTAGKETSLGAGLVSRQFKRQYDTEAKIIRLVREGGFDMPIFSKELISDADLSEIAKYVIGLPEER